MNEQGLLTFNDGKKKGNLGEQLSRELLFSQDFIEAKDSEEFLLWTITTSGPDKFFLDTRNNDNYHEPDVDFLCVDKTSKCEITKVEVKTDYLTYKTGNIFFECDLTQHSGWGLRSQADYIFYYAIHPDKKYDLYIIKLDELKQYVKEHPNLEKKGSERKVDYVKGKLVNINELLELGIAIK